MLVGAFCAAAAGAYPPELIREEGMPKGGIRRGRVDEAATTGTERARRGERRPASAPEVARIGGELRPGSETARLVAEVERLERELETARSRMAVLEASAEIDPLTGILNRRGFERQLRGALARAKRYGDTGALLYVDLDNLKPVNDSHGHAAGDAVLRAVADVLSRHVRDSDVVARLGGDEFGVLLWHLSEADADRKAHQLEEAITRTTATHAGAMLVLGASIGAAVLLPLDRPGDVLERADRAMYARKSARRTAAGSR
jgi:diguanylate cyclase (GGDEF)-like protein